MKSKNAQHSTIEPTRYVDFVTPLSIEETFKALWERQSHPDDIELRQVKLDSKRLNDDLYNLTGTRQNYLTLTGYLKRLPDNTTLVSIHIVARPELQNSVRAVQRAGLFIWVLFLTPIAVFLVADGGSALLLLGCVSLAIIVLTGPLFVHYLVTSWLDQKAINRRRDRTINALMYRLGGQDVAKISELDKEEGTDLPAQKAKQR